METSYKAGTFSGYGRDRLEEHKRCSRRGGLIQSLSTQMEKEEYIYLTCARKDHKAWGENDHRNTIPFKSKAQSSYRVVEG